MITIPNPQHARHAYREPPPPRAPKPTPHLHAATMRPADLPGHRITLTPTEPTIPLGSLPGPADLSLIDRSPVIAVLAPTGVTVVERWWDVLPRVAAAMYDATVRRLAAVHDTAVRMAWALDERQALLTQRLALLEEHARLEAWQRLPLWAQMAGQTHRRALTQLGPDTVRAAIVARALAATA